MSDSPKFQATDLAALLCSRVCHDIISPVGAINNGLEVLDENDDDPSMREFAMDLVRKSALQASAKLQFARLAFGAAGSAGASIDLMEAGKIAENFIDKDKINFTWNSPPQAVGKDSAKLVLNLLLIAINSIPRGGSMNVTITPDEDVFAKIVCEGKGARIPNDVKDYIGKNAKTPQDPHGVQPYYTGLIARQAQLKIRISLQGEAIIITAS